MLLGVCAQATDYYVDASGNDTNSGLSAGAAFKTIQKAISSAAAGDTVHVASGTYHESLDWENKDLIIQAAGPRLSVIDPSTANGGPGGRCVYTANLTSAARIQGFVFQNGAATNDCGGGMENDSSSPTITNCTFSSNLAQYYGGGMHGTYCSPTLTNCIFWGNSAWRGGAGMSNDLACSPVLTYSDVQDLPHATPDRNHNFGADPRFVRNPGTNGTSDYGDLHLLPTSPAINAGNNAVLTAPPFPTDPNGVLLDLDGKPRLTWGLVDLGTYEFQDIPTPTLSTISPSSLNAGGPAFTLTATSTIHCFLQDSAITWNGTALPTTFVSTSKLQASVPASFIANPGKAKITVVTRGGGTSAAKTLTIHQTSLSLALTSLLKNADGSYSAFFSLTNSGYLPATSLQIRASSLGAAATSDTLPLYVGTLGAGSTAYTALNYPPSAGASGTQVTLKVSATFTAGSASDSLKVVLP